MKHVLISCDVCAKVVPGKSVKDWWGLKTSGGVVQFAPLAPANIDVFKSHLCSRVCLGKVLQMTAQDVDVTTLRKAAVTAHKISYPTFSEMFGFSLGEPTSKPKRPVDDDEEEY